MNRLTMHEVHSFISGVGDAFIRDNENLPLWIVEEYHYYAVGFIAGRALPYIASLSLGIIIGGLI